jgi:hypothetical protein
MLLALYQKGALRPDLIRLLHAARAEGLYILAINTLKLSDPQALRGLIDCYIERPNFGRDFGSYKTGFLHLFQRGWHKTCPRLLMLNDSVFYSEARLPKFLNDLMTSEVEVLGATENFEIEYHLGSFCIAMAGSVLQKPRFQKYWRSYRLTDVRPRVIKRGEMKLSRTLKRCVSNYRQFKALYGASRYLEVLNKDQSVVEFSIRNGRTSALLHWDQFAPKKIVGFLKGKFINPANDMQAAVDVKVDADLDKINETIFIHSLESLELLIRANLQNVQDYDPKIVSDITISELTRIFMQGSQIHQNASILLHLGLPIVKLDGVYRGMFNVFDVQRICHQLEPHEGVELQNVLLERPFGGDTLTGWKRAAFMVGLI